LEAGAGPLADDGALEFIEAHRRCGTPAARQASAMRRWR
jgi:hypothetical protein